MTGNGSDEGSTVIGALRRLLPDMFATGSTDTPTRIGPGGQPGDDLSPSRTDPTIELDLEIETETQPPTQPSERFPTLSPPNPRLYRLLPAPGPTQTRDERVELDTIECSTCQLILGIWNNRIEVRAWTDCLPSALATVFGVAKATTTVTRAYSPEEWTLSSPSVLRHCLPAQAPPATAENVRSVTWRLLRAPAYVTQTLADLIDTLQDLGIPVVLAIDIDPETGTHLTFVCQLVVPESARDDYHKIDREIGTLFESGALTVTYQTDTLQPLSFPSETVADLTTIPTASTLHDCGVLDTNAPLTALDDHLAAPAETIMPLGYPVSAAGDPRPEPVGPGARHLPETILRVEAPEPSASAGSGARLPTAHLAVIAALGARSEPLLIIDTQGRLPEYANTLYCTRLFEKFMTPQHPMAILDQTPQDLEAMVEDHKPKPTWPHSMLWCRASDLAKALGPDRDRICYRPALETGAREFWHSARNMVVDLSESATPRMDASSLLLALDRAADQVSAPDRPHLGTVVVSDSALHVATSYCEQLATESALQERVTLLLRTRYPLGYHADRSGIDHRSVEQQTHLISELLGRSVDVLLVRNAPKPRQLLARQAFPRAVARPLRAIQTDDPESDWLCATLTPRTDAKPAVHTLRFAPSYTHRRDEPKLERSPHSKPVEQQPKEYINRTYRGVLSNEPLLSADGVSDSTPRTLAYDAPAGPDTQHSGARTRTQAHTREQTSGAVRTRLARPTQTTDDTLPPGVQFDTESESFVCLACNERYAPTQQGLKTVCQCCEKSATDIDRDALRAVPPLALKLSEREIARSQLDREQLEFLRAIHLAKQCKFDPVFQFDLLTDSMTLLVDDLDITRAQVDALCQMEADGQGLVTKQTESTPHTVYNVTAAGRKHIKEAAKLGRDWGDGTGDLNESTLHRLGVCLLCYYLAATYREAGQTVKAYHELSSEAVIDAVVLDSDGAVTVAAEMECENNDVRGADSSPRRTYRKLAGLDVTEAVWVFQTSNHWERATDDLAGAHRDPTTDISFRDSGYDRTYLSKEPALTYPGMTEAMGLSTLKETVDYPPGLFDRAPALFIG